MKSNKSYGLISEVHRIKEMMGINENKILLKEGIGDELVEALTKFLSKGSDELLSLGVKNADELTTLIKNFPTANVLDQANILKTIIAGLGDNAIRSIAKSTVDDVTTGIGKLMNNRTSQYIDFYKKGIMTYDDVISQVGDDISSIMSKSPDELTTLKNAINDEVKIRVSKNLDNAGGSAGKVGGGNTADDILEKLIKNNEKVDKILSGFKNTTHWQKLSSRQKSLFEQFVESNKDLDFATLMSRADTEFKNAVAKSLEPGMAEKAMKKWGTLKPWQKWAFGIGAGIGFNKLTGGTVLCGFRWLFDKLGEFIGVWDIEDQAFLNCTWDNESDSSENPNETSKSCNQTLETFKTFLTGQGFNSSTVNSATFDEKNCSGTVTLGDGSEETMKWNGSTFQ